MVTFNPPQDDMDTLSRIRQSTLAALSKIDERSLLELTELTLPEIHQIQEEIAQVLPVGNLPAMILTGLMQIKGRRIVGDRVRQDVAALLRGLDLLPQGLFGLFVGGPAAVLHVYQKLLRLAGKDADSAFPQGVWQFYLEFGLREDTARHVNETVGFQKTFPNLDDPVRKAAAWVYAAIDLVYQYNDLLSIDWREHMMLRIIQEQAEEAGLTEEPLFARLYRDWGRARPYRCPPNRKDYLRYRLETFETFIHDRLARLPAASRRRVRKLYAARKNTVRQGEEHDALAAYVEQMTLLAALTPAPYQEQKEPIPFWRVCVGFIWQGQTYLLPICQRDAKGSPLCFPPDEDKLPIMLYSHSEGLCDAHGEVLDVDGGGRVWYRESGQPLGNLRPPTPEMILVQLQSILSASASASPSNLDLALACCPRAVQTQLRANFPEQTLAELHKLRRVPIVINWDLQSYEQPLAYIRRGRRGIGDHAFTVFRTDASFVFDQSHIFFDGLGGMAVAEIMTNTAIAWCRDFANQPSVSQEDAGMPTALQLTYPSDMVAFVRGHCSSSEAAAESDAINYEGVSRLRKWLTQRGVNLTINDLLILNRVFHAAKYVPSQKIEKQLDSLRRRTKASDYKVLRQSIDQTLTHFREVNPALLIPMDASNVNPRDRIYPTTFRNPLTDMLSVFSVTRDAYQAYRKSYDLEDWTIFDQQRRELLAYLKAFGQFMETLRAVTMRGESFNAATLRLLGHLPPAMQHLLDQIPQRIGVLNEVIKGNEVFSNVGRAAPATSLQRFVSAKDDGTTKELVWGILGDSYGRVIISLRDFRPFVSMLLALGEQELADKMAQDYLDSYVAGFNRLVADLSTLVAVKAPES